jgi:ectoine hydroxylase-related dioxygenase (phytanoyl-CoA dioxygenase family)
MNIPQSIADELTKSYILTVKQIQFYKENGYIKLKNVFSENLIKYYNQEISDFISEKYQLQVSVEESNTYGKAFSQYFNLWRDDTIIEQLVLSIRLGKIASELMQTAGVRLYHDQALFKESGGGITPWHADQYYWPLETDKTITAWIPLTQVTLEMGPLEFSAGSQKIVEGRELAISEESEIKISEKLRITDFHHEKSEYDIGEISFHSGWTFHRAGANVSQKTRKVMTVIYMDSEMKLKAPANEDQVTDWKTWCPGTEIGKKIETYLNPEIF